MGMSLIVHGGAGRIPSNRAGAAREGCRAATEVGWRVLVNGGSALDAVQAAIMAMEDHSGFNAGTGAVLTADGRAQLDAGLMDGATLDVGAVASVERIKNPIALARLVLQGPHVLLAGSGAELYATESGMALCDPADLVTEAQRERWRQGYREAVQVGSVTSTATAQEAPPEQTAIHSDDTKHGTVGAVAVDARGNIAAGASTGGMAAKHPGRVGDTPIAGAGFYAENGVGGISSTGHGEHYIRLLLARRAAELLERGLSAEQAAQEAIRLLGTRTGGEGGLILLDAAGHVGYAHNSPQMARAVMHEGLPEPEAGI